MVNKHHPEVVVVLGSYAHERYIERSDIDLFIGYQRMRVADPQLEVFEKELSRRIEIFSGNLKEHHEDFVENIIKGVKLHGWLKL